MSMTTEQPPGGGTDELHLKSNVLSLFDSTAVAVASVAPAYSIASTIGLVVAAVGFTSPAIILVSFLPVLAIAFAYYYLNKQDPSCGASYSWVSRTMSPYLGWFNGWVQVAASVLFCTSASILIGQNTLSFLNTLNVIGSGTAASIYWTAFTSSIWFIFITWICIVGIRATANFQWVLVAIEYTAVIIFSIIAIFKVLANHPHGSSSFSFAWLNPLNIKGVSGLAVGAALGVFFFWGWDTASNLNEESQDAAETPGIAGINSMFLLLVVFLVNNIAMQMLVPSAVIQKQGGNALFYFAQQVLPKPWNYIMLLAILSSTVATTQTTLLPATRITLSMARDGVFPGIFAKIHKKWLTPVAGTILLAGLSFIGIWLTTFSSSVNSVFANMVADIGVLVAFYYGITGIGSAWAFRKVLTRKPSLLFFAGILPFIGGVFLLWIGYQVVSQSGLSTSLPILITLGAGIPLVLIARYTAKTNFFKTKAVAYELADIS
ncbi:MAG: APC family permease [Actinomycetota bacterium]|nr:APC family permease [Actinomycetota bacterium]